MLTEIGQSLMHAIVFLSSPIPGNAGLYEGFNFYLSLTDTAQRGGHPGHHAVTGL